jgi:hypothetical protein
MFEGFSQIQILEGALLKAYLSIPKGHDWSWIVPSTT